MPRVIDREKILKKNRNVNKTQLVEVSKILDQLKKSGIKVSEYNIAAPFSRRHRENEQEDSRTVHFRK